MLITILLTIINVLVLYIGCLLIKRYYVWNEYYKLATAIVLLALFQILYFIFPTVHQIIFGLCSLIIVSIVTYDKYKTIAENYRKELLAEYQKGYERHQRNMELRRIEHLKEKLQRKRELEKQKQKNR